MYPARSLAAVGVIAAVALFAAALLVRFNFQMHVAVYLNNREGGWPVLTAPAIFLFYATPYIAGLVAIAAHFIASARPQWATRVLTGIIVFGFVYWFAFEKGVLYALRPVT